MTDGPRPKQHGELQIAVLLGTTTFLAWAPAVDVEGLMDSFERRARATPADRGDQLAQAALRIRIVRDLRGPNAEALFNDVLAAGCLWLSLRHWSKSDAMQRGLTAQMKESGSAILTVSIADPAPDGMEPDTAWAFMIGDRIHDGRQQLQEAPPGEIVMISRDTEMDNG